MSVKQFVFILLLTNLCFSSIDAGFYADIKDELMTPPASASMAGSDLSIGSGVSVESTPGNLPFDSLNRLSLSYAGFFNNTFNTSILMYNGKPTKDIGISVLTGYIFIPNIPDNTKSSSNDSGELRELDESYFSASKMIFRAGAGRLFSLTPDILLGAGVALNAKRVRLSSEIGYGIGMDAGIKVLFQSIGLSFATQLENVTSSYTYWNKNFQERGYHHLRTGVGFEHYFTSLYGALRLCYTTPDLFGNEGINYRTWELTENENVIDSLGQYELYEHPSLLVTQGKYGIEYTIMNAISFRGGLSNNQITFGAGLNLMNNKAGIDIAYIVHELGGTYQLSINGKW
jgi:hypothetical protein